MVRTTSFLLTTWVATMAAASYTGDAPAPVLASAPAPIEAGPKSSKHGEVLDFSGVKVG